MYSVPLPTLASHSLSSFATNSGPLSERMFSGIPRNSITSASASITSYLPSLLATRIARHSRVYSSISVNIRNILPSCVIALTKSYPHTWFARADRSRTHDPSFSHNLPRGLCFCGTFSPSRRQIRCTRSLPIEQPRSCHSAVIRRVALTPVFAGQHPYLTCQLILVRAVALVALRSSPLPQQPAGIPLRYSVAFACM